MSAPEYRCYAATHVFVNGRTQTKIDAVAADIKRWGSATPLLADVTEAEINEALQAIAADSRPLGYYNAGNNRPEISRCDA